MVDSTIASDIATVSCLAILAIILLVIGINLKSWVCILLGVLWGIGAFFAARDMRGFERKYNTEDDDNA